jgi:hypothetical protein
VILIAVVGQGCFEPVPPAPPAPPPLPEPSTKEQAVTYCVADVNWGNNTPFLRFDAYIDPVEGVQAFGLPAQNYRFQKCMAMHGHSIQLHPED